MPLWFFVCLILRRGTNPPLTFEEPKYLFKTAAFPYDGHTRCVVNRQTWPPLSIHLKEGHFHILWNMDTFSVSLTFLHSQFRVLSNLLTVAYMVFLKCVLDTLEPLLCVYFPVLIICCYVGSLGSKWQADEPPEFTSGSSETKSQFVWRAIFVLHKQCSSLVWNWKWADVHLLSLKATYPTGCCNQKEDVLSHSKHLSLDSQRGDSAHLVHLFQARSQ